MLAFYKKSSFAAFITVFFLAVGFEAHAQSGGSSTSVTGTVVDPTGAVVANAVVEIHNPVSAFERTVTTDSSGKFNIPNVPFNPYHLTVTGPDFAPYAQDVDVRSIVPVTVSVTLQIKGLVRNRDRGRGRRGPAGEYFDVSHRCGSRFV